MKFDALDKFDLEKEKKVKNELVLLLFFLFFILMLFLFIIYLSSIKIEKIDLLIEDISKENEDEFKILFIDKSCLQIIMPNFKKNLVKLYFIDQVKIIYIPFNTVKIKIIEKQPYCIIYDRNRGIFYQISKEFYVLKIVNDISILKMNIVSLNLTKIYKKGDKIEINSNKIDFNNEDCLLSEIIVDNENILGVPFNDNYLIYFGSFLNRIKLENLKLFFTLTDIKNDIRFQKIKYVDMSYPEIARIIIE